MFKVEIGPAALADIEQIYLWLKGQPATASSADAWFVGISETILSLETMPRRYPLAPEAKTMAREIHQLLYGKGAYATAFCSSSMATKSFMSCAFDMRPDLLLRAANSPFSLASIRKRVLTQK